MKKMVGMVNPASILNEILVSMVANLRDHTFPCVFTMGESVGLHVWIHLMRMEAFVSKKPLNIANPPLVSTK